MGVGLVFAIGLDGALPPRPPDGTATVGRRYVGSQGLLEELELRLGLASRTPTEHERRLELLTVLRNRQDRDYFFSRSFAVDPIGVAAELLTRRDELIASGLPMVDANDTPVRIRDLIELERAIESESVICRGTADRLRSVSRALASDTCPVALDEVEVCDSPALLPTGFEALLKAVQSAGVRIVYRSPEPAAPADSLLGAVQRMLLGKKSTLRTVKATDESLVFAIAPSSGDAAELITRFARSDANEPADEFTIVTSSDECWFLAHAFRQDGTPANPASDSLPLPDLSALALLPSFLYSPAEPQKLVALLLSRAAPLVWGLSRRLAHALESEPGIGGPAWQRAIKRWKEGETDADLVAKGHLQYEQWFGSTRPVRSRHGDLVPADDAAELFLRAAESYAPTSRIANCARRIASGLGTVYGKNEISRSDLTRFTRDVISSEPVMTLAGDAGSPRLFSDPGEVIVPARTVIWSPATTAESIPTEFWRSEELTWLDEQGTPVQPASISGERSFHSAMHGFMNCMGSSIVVLPSMQGGQTVQEHPVAVAARTIAEAIRGKKTPTPLDEVLRSLLASREQTAALRESFPPRTLPGRRASWELGTGTLSFPDRKESPTSLSTLCDYPYIYVLQRVANITRAGHGKLPSGPLLWGNVLHAAAAEYFEDGVDGGDDADAWLDRRLPSILSQTGLPLLQPGAESERESVRRAISSTVTLLAREFQARGATAVRFEHSPEPVALGPVQLGGRIDVYITGAGTPAVVDIKWGGRSYRTREVEDGRDIQLSIYALLVGAVSGGLDLGYLIGTSGTLISHAGSGFAHAFSPQNAEPSTQSVPALLSRIEETIRWRRDQFAAGTIELAPPECLALPGPPAGALSRPDEPNKYDDYTTLLGWSTP